MNTSGAVVQLTPGRLGWDLPFSISEELLAGAGAASQPAQGPGSHQAGSNAPCSKPNPYLASEPGG